MMLPANDSKRKAIENRHMIIKEYSPECVTVMYGMACRAIMKNCSVSTTLKVSTQSET